MIGTRLTSRWRRSTAVAALGVALLVFLAVPGAYGQAGQTPVYMDDSTAAEEGVARARDQLARGNADEAVDVLRDLLRSQGQRVLALEDEPRLFHSVRDVIHRLLLRNPELFERYLAIESPEARRMLEVGQVVEVERVALLTPAGFEAALRLAQRRLESAQFESAWQTLMQLEDHPQRRTIDPGAEAARLAGLVAEYLPPDARDAATVSRWRDEAGLDPAPEIERIAGPELEEGVTPFEPAPPVDLSGIVSRPLWSEPLAIQTDEDEEAEEDDPRDRMNRGRRSNSPWRVFPTVSGDTIYINDGSSVAAWDRFTLAPRWRTELLPAAEQSEAARARTGAVQRNRRSAAVGARTVTITGRWVVAAADEPDIARRDQPTVVVAMDAETGRVRWRTALAAAAPSLEGATIEGRLIVDQGVVLVLVSKDLAERRLDSAQLMALELTTGRPLWLRPLGSTGTLPFASSDSSADLPVTHRGVVYVVDTLGFAAAVETVSGRTRWIRDLAVDRNLLAPREPWAATGAIVRRDSVFAVTPDNLRIVELDGRSGREIASRSAARLLGEDQSPLYLLDAGDQLAIVGSSAIYTIGMDAFADESVRAEPALDLGTESFRGRAVIAGDMALAPTRTGLRSASLTEPGGAEPALTHLEEPGNVLAMESQLVVVDDQAVRTYLLWDVAQRVLTERMERTPTDPTPAVTFAELAYRAGKPDRILPAVRQALGSIERDPLSPRNRTSRARLFRSVLAMVEPDADDPQLGSLSREQFESLLGELGRAASEPEERVQHLMARGRFYESEERIDEAIEAYQRVLDDDRLAAAKMESGAGSMGSAQNVATRSLRRVVRRFGAGVYAPYEVEARRMLEDVPPAAGPEEYARVAQRYPVSRAGAQAWLDAASAYLSRGRPHGAVFALESGLQTAEDALAIDDELVGELAGRLIKLLSQTGRVAAASETLDRLTAQRPMLPLTDRGAPISIDALRAELSDQLALLDRRPEIGLLGDAPPVQSLDGWSVMTPVIRRPVGAPTDMIVMESEGEIGVWGVAQPTGVSQRWSVQADQHTALLDYDDRSVFLTSRGDGGRVYVRHNIESGDLIWASSPFPELFEIDGEERARTVQTELDGIRSAVEQVVALDDATLLIADRGGRVAAYDKSTGKLLWKLPRTIDVIADMAINAGVIAIAGSRTQDGVMGSPVPAMIVLDSRTGQVQHRVDLETGAAHWVRVTDAAEAIVGTSGAISLYDVFTGRRRWSVGGASGRRTVEAWVFPGRVIAQNDRGELRQIETESGAPLDRALETRERVTSSVPIIGGAVGDRAAFASTIGILIYDRHGELVGVDHRPTGTAMHPAEFGADRFVTVGMVAGSIDGEVFYYDLEFFSIRSCALEQRRAVGLYPTPTRLALLDGRILITSGPGTVVLDTE